ncbi:hypothetical protein [Hymenobacter guriensis]|uniref:Uncharacterized protein n=1 Tax=Hymenobacter guriensis TaxID=2793065 RepID=A0ABS0KXJ5_9BACT|nr:hypothetical protein [Hymenobacter guriensis]MBG8552574.1 hypothetical protein [Hymenobacter guriensis]
MSSTSLPPYRSALAALLAVRHTIAQRYLGLPVEQVADWAAAMDDLVQHLADQAGHGDAEVIEQELIAPLEERLGVDYAYHPAFNQEFPVFVALLPLHALEQNLAQRCWELQLDPALDYQYLADLLAEAELPEALPPALAQRYAVAPGEYPTAPHRTGRLARAIEWLHRQREQALAGGAVLPAPASTAPPASALVSMPASTSDRAPWAGVLASSYPAADLLGLLQRLGLVAADGRTPTVEATPGAWVGAVAALREKGLLMRRNDAAVVRALSQAFGEVVSERTLQRGYQPDNELHHRWYTRTLAFAGS